MGLDIEKTTVSLDHCIGCGMCEAVCPYDAIDMIYNANLEVEPKINHDLCAEKCTTCVIFCPFTEDKIIAEAEKLKEYSNPHMYGLDQGKYYLSYDKRDAQRQKSASGGVVTELAISMLKGGLINAVIHAQMLSNPIGEEHYSAAVSWNVEELEGKRSSFYTSMAFGEALEAFSGKEASVLLIAVPCVVRAVKGITEKHKGYKNLTLYTTALACSHIVNGQFVDYLAEVGGVKDKRFYANLRDKEDIPDANNFNNKFYDASTVYSSENRFKNDFTNLWRNYFFSKNICFKCSDFWGYTADISVKDAWGKWSDESLGKSIVVFRDSKLESHFHENKNLLSESLTIDEVLYCQKATTDFKHVDVHDRINEPFFSRSNIKSGYVYYYLFSILSKSFYRVLGVKAIKAFLFVGVNVMKFSNGIVSRDWGVKKTINVLKFIFYKFGLLKKVFIYKNNSDSNKILVAGGYGYDNVGDEAQLSSCINVLKKSFPEYLLVVLTHDRKLTSDRHGGVQVFDSPREAFYDHNEKSYYWLNSLANKINFLMMSVIIYLNAFLVRADLPTFFVGAKRSALLVELKKSSLLFYCGGGYLTGKTQSRLWDGMFFMAIAKIMDVPIVLSGQTIGVWGGFFNRSIARWGLSKVNVISVRDPEESMDALHDLGLEGSNYFSTFDDALFCDKSTSDVVDIWLQDSKIGNEPYVAFNIHYWGVDRIEDRLALLSRINMIVEHVLSTTANKILFIPMTPSDELTNSEYEKFYPSKRVSSLRYDYDFKVMRGVISRSSLCVTMKHHPIIFALGEQKPVISLALSKYYEHKNKGALKLFGLERFSINFDSDFSIDEFKVVLDNVNAVSKDDYRVLREKLNSLLTKKELFWEKVNKLL